MSLKIYFVKRNYIKLRLKQPVLRFWYNLVHFYAENQYYVKLLSTFTFFCLRESELWKEIDILNC